MIDWDEPFDAEVVTDYQELYFFMDNLRASMDEVDPANLTPDEASSMIYMLNRLWEHAFYRKCLNRAAEGLIEEKKRQTSDQH